MALKFEFHVVFFLFFFQQFKSGKNIFNSQTVQKQVANQIQPSGCPLPTLKLFDSRSDAASTLVFPFSKLNIPGIYIYFL